MTENKEWLYVDRRTNTQVGPLTLSELDQAFNEGKFEGFHHVFSPNIPGNEGPEMRRGISYSQIPRSIVAFSPTLEDFFAARSSKSTTVLSGANNSGKSLIIKKLYPLIGNKAYMLACNRFSSVDVLNSRQKDRYEKQRLFENAVQQQYTSQQNTETNDRQIEQIVAGLNNDQRNNLFLVAEELLGNKFRLQKTEPNNDLSPFYIDMDGQNLKFGSSGTRLLMVLLGNLLDPDYSVILIDEPELGLSPKIQATLARRLFDIDWRNRYFPHLKQVFIVTHSHVFLDRSNLTNNFIVEKSGDNIAIRGVRSVAELHQLQFGMLGNDLELLFLPSAVVVVEGHSDSTFLTKVLQIHIPDKKISIVASGGDGKTTTTVHILTSAFGDLANSPYRSRVFVVLDQIHSVSPDHLIRMGVLPDNIIIWSRNGIEYLYPSALVAKAFRCDVADLATVDLSNDEITVNGDKKSKKQLARLVTEDLTAEHNVQPELAALVDKIKVACQ